MILIKKKSINSFQKNKEGDLLEIERKSKKQEAYLLKLKISRNHFDNFLSYPF